LDTHVLIWFSENDPLLSENAKAAIENSENEKHVSIASFWEMAIKIKISIGKLQVDMPLNKLAMKLEENGIRILPLNIESVSNVAGLPFHHKDPFDRILACECIPLDYRLVSNDAIFDRYGVKRIW